MERKDFEIFKKEVLVNYLDELKNLDNKNCLFINDKALNKIYIYYQKSRNIIKRAHMVKNTQALDRHKVGSCLMYGILRAKIIRVNKRIPDLPPYLLMANEYFAINVAINIVEMYRSTEGKEDYTIKLPVSYHKKENKNYTFLYELCTSLYNEKTKKHFDVFAYAAILFQLEHLTDYILSGEDRRKDLIE